MLDEILKECPTCGMKYVPKRNGQVYCCHACANMAQRNTERGEFDHSLTWKRDANQLWQCPYNECVSCYVRRCSKCGWNPEVAKARTEAIERKLRGEDGNL